MVALQHLFILGVFPIKIHNQKRRNNMGLTATQVRQLNNMNAAAQRAQLGTILGILGGVGDVYYLDPANGLDTNAGTAPGSAFKSMETAEAALTANQNDVLVYMAGSSGLTLQTALTWDKSYTHLVGACAPTHAGQRARIFQLSILTGASPLITVSASGSIFKDLYVFQGVDDATSLIDVSVTGGRNYFENVHFAGGGHATQAVDGGASLKVVGSENKFAGCTIGVDTISAGTGMVGILFAGADGGGARNLFDKCHVSMLAGHTGAAWVEVSGVTSIDRYNIFDGCLFTNTNFTNFAMASGFVIPAIAANRPSRIFLKDCVGYGASKWDASDRGILFGNMDAITGADLSGVMVEIKT